MPVISRLGRTLFRSIKSLVQVNGSHQVVAGAGASAARTGQQIRPWSQSSLQQTTPALHRSILRGIVGQPNLQRSLIKGHAAVRLMKIFGPRAPAFAFLGLVYSNFSVKQPTEVQLERDQCRQLQSWVQDALNASKQKIQQQKTQSDQSGLKLSDYQLGERLGQPSSEAAVYAATHNTEQFAVKMLFNYYTSSHSSRLYQEFGKEHAVLSQEPARSLQSHSATPTYTQLPPHPNIVPVLHSFADQVPCLPDAQASYPAALPRRHARGGMGRNRTLFLVMPRLGKTVREFVRTSTASPAVASQLFTQLLEGVSHCTAHDVAHRDLKSDNLLLDESCKPCPRLVIADFGCCLADERLGLQLPFLTEETSRGGNPQLMAPEVATATAGEGVVIDYSKADAWAAGAIAHELFGQENPFDTLTSFSYSEDQLPVLSRASPQVQRVVSLLLRRDPTQRITAAQAAIMMHLILWAPGHWIESRAEHPEECEVSRWLTGLCLRVHLSSAVSTQTTREQLLSMFALRTSVEDVMEALYLFHEPLQ